MEQVFEIFSSLLKERFSKKIYTTEDTIRYNFFYALTHAPPFVPSDIIVEHPHPGISGAKIDTYIPPSESHAGYAFEFKFDRAIPSEKNSPRTQKAGKVFADLFRLTRFSSDPKIKKIFIYVSDGEMTSYFLNPANHFTEFFMLKPGTSFVIDDRFFNKHAATFVNSAGKFTPCNVLSLRSENLPNAMSLRIYQVT